MDVMKTTKEKNPTNPSNCDGQIFAPNKGMKRYAKKYYITKIQLGWTNGYAQKKEERNIIQLGWTDTTKYYIRNSRRI
jgi:hypothetical protein